MADYCIYCNKRVTCYCRCCHCKISDEKNVANGFYGEIVKDKLMSKAERGYYEKKGS